MQDPVPSFIHPSAKWEPDAQRAQELMLELLEVTGAQSLSVLLYDCPMPCPEIVSTGNCTIGHRYAIRGTIDHTTLHDLWLQLLKMCPGHKIFFKNND
jgi:hypothetical protein